MTRSISLPMEPRPAPCIRRLVLGGLPQASGKTCFTAVQYTTRTFHIPSKSVSPVAMLRYGNKQPEGDRRLSWMNLITDVSDITAFARASEFDDVRRIM